jgi:hypothetical protein
MRLRAIVPLFVVTTFMFGDTLYNESVSGDLSNNWAAPTFLSFTSGSNQVLGTLVGPSDRDYFSFNVPVGYQIAAINVLPGTVGGGPGLVSFFGIDSGLSFLPPDTTANATLAASLLGYTLYGASNVGSSILPSLATSNTSSPPAQGFTSLGPGNYSIWLQEGATGTFPYGFNIVIATPEPATWLLCFAALAIVVPARRRIASSYRRPRAQRP